MNAGKKILIGFAVLVGIVILFGAIGKASQDKPRPEADICTSGYDALDTDTRFECAKKRHLNAMTGGHPKAVAALRRHLKYPETLHVEDTRLFPPLSNASTYRVCMSYRAQNTLGAASGGLACAECDLKTGAVLGMDITE